MATAELDTYRVIGVSRPRIDSREKVIGATHYAGDNALPGLLHARIVPSIYAHAWIRGVDASAALALPGVVAVLVCKDLPIKHRDDMRMFEPLARGEATFVGQPVALVVAETPEAAQDAIEHVVVDYEPLDNVIDVEAAMGPAAPLARNNPIVPPDEDVEDARSVHAAVGGAGADLDDEELSPNVVARKRYRDGDAAAALAGSDVVVEGRFRTNWVYQGYLETHVATAWLESDGRLTVESSTQGIFFARKQLAKIYGLPLAQVRVIGAPLGGAFGSKLLVVDPLVAGATLVLRRPVRLELNRREDIAATNPAQASVTTIRIGARKDGTLTALDTRIVCDAGAFAEWSIEGIAAVLIANVYHWQAYDIRAYGVRTNRVGTGSYRGPGGPQAYIAIETLMDELAAKLGIDPLDLRRNNLVAEGEEMVDGEVWPKIGARECLDAIAGHPLWQRREQLPEGEGIGLSVGFWPGGKEPAAALCRLNSDGTLNVATGTVDMTGVATNFAVIAAEAFGLDAENVDVVALDTAGAPPAPISGGSVVTYSVGAAVRAAAIDARRQLLAYASQLLEISAADLEIKDGIVQPKGSPDRGVPVKELAEQLGDFGATHPPVEGHASELHKSLAPSTAAHVVHVRLDRESGEVEVKGLVVAQDVGRALNPALVLGQMHGGAAQGLGWALWEEMVHDDQGQLLTGTLMDYALPRAAQMPAFETLVVEVPAPDGPFGAKGIGEASVLSAPAAVANAIAAAGGPRLRELPMTARRIWQASQGTDGAGT
jgi:CO/xanthine dehydrogenase Mo-binding subunit